MLRELVILHRGGDVFRLCMYEDCLTAEDASESMWLEFREGCVGSIVDEANSLNLAG